MAIETPQNQRELWIRPYRNKTEANSGCEEKYQLVRENGALFECKGEEQNAICSPIALHPTGFR